ncbi:phage baseplate protein [Salmonella enterica]|nr:phage baseplate protein [Salmonella enterica]
MLGMDRRTGRAIDDTEQLISRLAQVMTTPKGARNRVRDFGSDVPKYFSANLNPTTALLMKSAAFSALKEPVNGMLDFDCSKITIQPTETGCFMLFTGKFNGKTTTVSVPLNV